MDVACDDGTGVVTVHDEAVTCAICKPVVRMPTPDEESLSFKDWHDQHSFTAQWPKGYTPSRRRTGQMKMLGLTMDRATELALRHYRDMNRLIDIQKAILVLRETAQVRDLTSAEMDTLKAHIETVLDCTWRQR